MRCAEKVAAAYALGQRDGLDAAREAVVVLCWRTQYSGFVSTVDPLRVLAAIDALKEEQ
jgi:hypothetical protein